MKKIIPIVVGALLVSLSPAIAKTNRVSEADLRNLATLEEGELQGQLTIWMANWDLFPLGWTNTVAVFQMGDHLRPSLTNLVKSSDRNVSRGAKNLLQVIGHPDDVEIFKLFRAKQTRAAIQSKTLDEAVKRWTLTSLLERLTLFDKARKQLDRNCNRALVCESLFFALL